MRRRDACSPLGRVTIFACKSLQLFLLVTFRLLRSCLLSLVGEVNLVVDKNRVDGTRVRLAEVEVGDETGTVSLRARDEQIDLLREVSQRSGAIVLRNCALELYQGKHIRLATTKWGKLSPYPDQIASTPPPPSKINRDRNFSHIDLSVVASEMVSFAQADPYSQSLEGENQPSSMMNRSQPYQNSSFRGGRGRRPSPKQQHSGAPAPMPHYSDPRLASMPYPSGLHGYSGMDTSGYSTYRQQENLTSAQQMMLHQQYEMQHRQMHQMYSPQEQRSPMMSPVIPPAASFDTSFSVGSEVPMPVPGSNPFLMPIQTSPPQGPGQSPQAQASRGQQQQQQQPSPQQASTPETPGKMNPQAATFDPSYRSHYSRK